MGDCHTLLAHHWQTHLTALTDLVRSQSGFSTKQEHNLTPLQSLSMAFRDYQAILFLFFL